MSRQTVVAAGSATEKKSSLYNSSKRAKEKPRAVRVMKRGNAKDNKFDVDIYEKKKKKTFVFFGVFLARR